MAGGGARMSHVTRQLDGGDEEGNPIDAARQASKCLQIQQVDLLESQYTWIFFFFYHQDVMREGREGDIVLLIIEKPLKAGH